MLLYNNFKFYLLSFIILIFQFLFLAIIKEFESDFRNYIEIYLDKAKNINSDMTVMCRQLSPTPHGIPLEIYAFSNNKEWKNYEHIMSDIFDHLIASLSNFQLELFEYPSSLK